MPYIICTYLSGNEPEDRGYAVATIEEAREEAGGRILSIGYDDVSGPWAEQAFNVPDTGGRIGPLPDDCVIDVRAVTWQALAGLANLSAATYLRAELPGAGGEHFQTQIIDAYNKGDA